MRPGFGFSPVEVLVSSLVARLTMFINRLTMLVTRLMTMLSSRRQQSIACVKPAHVSSKLSTCRRNHFEAFPIIIRPDTCDRGLWVFQFFMRFDDCSCLHLRGVVLLGSVLCYFVVYGKGSDTESFLIGAGPLSFCGFLLFLSLSLGPWPVFLFP